MTELILRYLWFEDKVRLECVSKQWRRLIYNKQIGLTIKYLDSEQRKCSLRQLTHRNRNQSNDRIDRKALESVLKTCRFITGISCWVETNSEVLALIGRYCPRIKSLYYRRNGVNGQTLWSLIGHCFHYLWSFFYRSETELSFHQKYGHKLKALDIYQENVSEEDNEQIKQFLKFCPNITEVFVPKFSLLLNENREYLPKLKHIFIECKYSIESEKVNKIKILSDKNSQTLNTFYVEFESLTEEELKTCIECICRLEKLKRLKMYFNSWENTEHIENSLSMIGQKCTKLSQLEFHVEHVMPIPNHLFDAFSHFKDITKLGIRLSTFSIVKPSVESLKTCKQLMKLEISYLPLEEDYFTNVRSFLPKLKRLEILTEKHFSETFIDSMKNIEKVFLGVRDETNGTYDQKYWYFGKCLSEVMSSPKGKDVIRVNDNCGLYCCDVNTNWRFSEEV